MNNPSTALKHTVAAALIVALAVPAISGADLRFDPQAFTEHELVMPDGHKVKYLAYENIPYVSNPVLPELQVLNFYIPANRQRDQKCPILLRNYVGGYMQSRPRRPSPGDASGRALREGMAVCIPGVRGSDSRNTDGAYVGVAPAPLIDLKAAVRYLRYNDAVMPGDASKIVSDGTSAGGALSALLGTTADNALYAPALAREGAAPASDAVFAAVCYCPITDLNHADMEYEWLFSPLNSTVRDLSPAQAQISDELAAGCPEYINSLGLVTPDGTTLTASNYRAYLRILLMKSAEAALEAGCPIPDSIGVTIYDQRTVEPGYPVYTNPPMPLAPPPGRGSGWGPPPPPPQPQLVYTPPTIIYSDYVAALDLGKYLHYVAEVSPLKTPPAFDRYGVLDQAPTPENRLFGDGAGNPRNFTDFSLRQRTDNPSASISATEQTIVDMMNPMAFLSAGDTPATVHWYIRHGALDTDTSFLVPVNLTLKLQEAGCDVDFFIPWNRVHQGDYNLDGLFHWIKSVTR